MSVRVDSYNRDFGRGALRDHFSQQLLGVGASGEPWLSYSLEAAMPLHMNSRYSSPVGSKNRSRTPLVSFRNATLLSLGRTFANESFAEETNDILLLDCLSCDPSLGLWTKPELSSNEAFFRHADKRLCPGNLEQPRK